MITWNEWKCTWIAFEHMRNMPAIHTHTHKHIRLQTLKRFDGHIYVRAQPLTNTHARNVGEIASKRIPLPGPDNSH